MTKRHVLKFFIALLLLPAGVALTITSWRIARELAFGLHQQSRMIGLAFWGGYAVWLAIFAFLPKTIRTYVLGHELTHALWALMMGARVSGLRVGKTGGQVRTSKNNWLITLAPYFFPFYAVLFMVVFFVADLVWGLDQQVSVLFFLVGLGWSFHVSFTIYTLLTAQQPDVKSQGWLFSMVVIFCMNLVTILLTVALLSRAVSFATVISGIGQDLATVYGWTLDKWISLWQSLVR